MVYAKLPYGKEAAGTLIETDSDAGLFLFTFLLVTTSYLMYYKDMKNLARLLPSRFGLSKWGASAIKL